MALVRLTPNRHIVSSEDSFRSNLVDLLSIYSTVDKIGVNRVGIADTVGCASPRQGKLSLRRLALPAHVHTLILALSSVRPCQDPEGSRVMVSCPPMCSPCFRARPITER